MEYVTFGRSGLRVSRLGLGTLLFGQRSCMSPAESEAVLSRFVEHGGNFVDTANVYAAGQSEEALGAVIRRLGASRDRLVVGTKFFGQTDPRDPNSGGCGRKAILAACDQSLRRLRTDYIDIYWMHCWDRLTPIDETMQTLDDLVWSGKVRYIGFSNTPAWKTMEAQTVAWAHAGVPLIGVQMPYSLMQRTIEGELLPMTAELGLGVAAWEPLGGGALARRSPVAALPSNGGGSPSLRTLLADRSVLIAREVLRVADDIGAAPAVVALAWLNARPGLSTMIVGCRRPEQLDQNMEAMRLRLDSAHVAALDRVSEPALNFPAGFQYANPEEQIGQTIQASPAMRVMSAAAIASNSSRHGDNES